MEGLVWGIIGVLVSIIIALLIKIALLRKSAREIEEAFFNCLMTDTNAVIDISSGDSYMRKLAAAMNQQLRLLRKQRQKYLYGDLELKEAVTNISHDLRTPLTAICGYMDLLEQEEKTENVARYLSHIENRIEALKVLTEELFQYSVILAKQEELELDSVCVNSVLEESIADFYGALTEKGVVPIISITEVPVNRSLNKVALTRVFENILNNALKYSDGDLEIVLAEDGQILFSNSASELDDVVVGRLFDRFFTVENARKSTGLGLSIAKTLIEQMNGSITANYSNQKLNIVISFSERQK